SCCTGQFSATEGDEEPPAEFPEPRPIDFKYDYNHDGLVNATDQLIARANQTNFLTALKLITAPAATTTGATAAFRASAAAAAPAKPAGKAKGISHRVSHHKA